MKLKKITIENYRSIENISFEIQEISGKTCLIFLGINESGKSNILQAVALLDKSREVNYNNDCNKKAIKEYKDINIIFEFDIINRDNYIEQLRGKGLEDILVDTIKIENIFKKIIFNKNKERKDELNIIINNNVDFSKFIVNNNDNTVKFIYDIHSGGEELTKENIKLILGKEYEILNKKMLERLLAKQFKDIFEKNVPKSIYWKLSKEYLINEPIDLNHFKSNINSSIPLRNIFMISGVKNIEERIDLITNNLQERFELVELLTENTTNYINQRWPELEVNIKILIDNNLSCSVMVEDKDYHIQKYEINQRSDGFKQFLSILLNLSAENETELLKNKIVILDEPDVHLHPSGIKYLRDELLNISINNVILIASHSIFIVDNLNLDRHYKVEKEKSVTNIFQIDKNNPYQEEVIYNALGTSKFEIIEPNMIIFEGRTDKDIFDVFTKKFERDIKPLNIGTISADGVQKIPKYTKFFNNKIVKGFVIVDSDKEGKDIKSKILKERNYNKKNTFEINEIKNTKKEATLEDLLPEDIVLKCTNDRYNLEIFIDNPKIRTPIITLVYQNLKSNNKIKSKDELNELKADICKYVIKDIQNLTNDEVISKYSYYFDFVNKLHNKLKDVDDTTNSDESIKVVATSEKPENLSTA